MAYVIDPEGHERETLHTLCDFRGKDVVEVGCGDGRLTWRYADLARSVLGLDPNPVRVEQAMATTPDSLRSTVTFRVADITHTTLAPSAFDLAILSWSL